MTMDKPTVLIVEDNAITRKMIRVALESEGYVYQSGASWLGQKTSALDQPSFIR
jgi:CheY-like chemotaxis protein